MNTREANFQLKQLVDDFGRAFQTISEESRTALLRHSTAGERIPVPGRLYGNEYRAQFTARCDEIRGAVAAVINEQIDNIKAAMAEAPSAEAVNTVQMLALRDDIADDEIDIVLGKYGDNYQAAMAIISVAASKGLHGWSCTVEKQLADLEALLSTMRRTMTATSAENGHASSGYLEMLKIQIDFVLPATA